jgi:hypothetical protein
MKIITNQQLIKRNKQIGQITTVASLVILGLGLYLSFKSLYLTWSFIALIAGFILSQFGIYYGARWGRSPRPDEQIDAALKGLDNKYTIYHYKTPVSHLLIGPGGAFLLAVYNQPGTISYDSDKKRWRQKGGNLYMKIFAQEGLGRPEMDVQNQFEKLNKYFSKKFDSPDEIKVEPVIVFTNEKAIVDQDESPIAAVTSKKLKDYIRRKAKQNSLDVDLLSTIEQQLSPE